MRYLAKLVLSGLVTVLPVALTLSIIWWLGTWIEAALGGLLRSVLPEALYLPGAGIVVGLVLLIVVGLFMRAVLAQKIAALMDRMLDRIPLVKILYGALSDFVSLFSQEPGKQVDQVVLIRPFDSPVQILGLVTRPGVAELDPGPEDDPVAAVYIPMSYGLGGYTMLVRRSLLTPVDMTVAEALRFAITAGAPLKGG